MKTIKLASLIFIISTMLIQTAAHAESFRARIVKIEGHVYVVNAEGEQRKPAKKQYLVNSNETVITRKDSKAVIQFEDGAMSVLDEKSSLRVEQSGWLSQLGGKVYYVFRKVFGRDKPKKVKTKFATIGIRGTTFIVNVDFNNQQVALQEGKLNIESPEGDYEVLKADVKADDFAAFKKQSKRDKQLMDDEFLEYKKKINKEFVEYKKSFDLEANTVVSISGKRVVETELDQGWESSFDDFSEFSKDYIDAYRELDKDAKNNSPD